jgi:O-antigen/teichoic acid export membrane protein
VSGQYNWFKETIPLQWRYAISWTAGYFIFQFIVPVAMFYVGADMAGKLGLSFTIVRSVQAMANSWGVTKIPQFNMLVAKKNRSELDKLLNTIQKQSLSVYAAGTIATILIFIFIFPLINWSDRVLPLSEIIIILIAEGIHLIVFNWAYYLRSHKQEPYMKISVLSAILTAIGIWASFYLFSSTFIALCSYLLAQLITIIPARRIFIKKRKEYENNQIGY